MLVNLRSFCEISVTFKIKNNDTELDFIEMLKVEK